MFWQLTLNAWSIKKKKGRRKKILSQSLQISSVGALLQCLLTRPFTTCPIQLALSFTSCLHKWKLRVFSGHFLLFCPGHLHSLLNSRAFRVPFMPCVTLPNPFLPRLFYLLLVPIAVLCPRLLCQYLCLQIFLGKAVYDATPALGITPVVWNKGWPVCWSLRELPVKIRSICFLWH